MRTVRPLFTLIALGLLAGSGAAGCARHESTHREQKPVSVQVQTVHVQSEAATVEAVGTLRAAQEATIAGKVMGTVTEIRKNAGDPVREGEVLLTIDSRDVVGQIAQAEGALAQARAAAALAETNFRRFEQLFARGAASQLELDQARYQHETAQGALKQAEGAVMTAGSYEAYARIPAPFTGRLVDRLCEVGDLAAPGRPLLKIEDASRLRLFASLEAGKADAAQVGVSVRVQIPALEGRVFDGTVTEVVPAADPATRSILVKIDLQADPGLRSGLFGRAYLPAGQKQAIRVPRSAVVQRGGVTGVFVAENGKAALRLVSLRADEPELPEVLSGLSSGDAVILNPPEGLAVGAPVEVRP